jgi:hypothetical protein
MKITKGIIAVVVAVVLITGCGNTMPPLNFTTPNVGVSHKKIDAEIKSMTVTIARPDEKSGEIDQTIVQAVPQLWQTALTEGLNKMAIFQDDAHIKVNLSVKILKLYLPATGFDITTETSARYEIINRKTGDIIFTQDISSIGTTPIDYSFMANIRGRESINRSVQNNITKFLQSIETINIQKPMFPAASN